MTTAPTTCLDHIASGNVGLVELLKSPFEPTLGTGNGSCSLSNAVDQLQNTLSSIDLSFDLSSNDYIGQWLNERRVSGKYNIELPDLRTMITLVSGGSLSITIGFVFSILLYYLVVPGKRLVLRKVFVGTLLLASSCAIPYMIFDALHVENTAARFSICTPFVLYGFKILEAMFGFVPVGAQSSFITYCQYFVLPAEILFDNETSKPILATTKDLLDSVRNVLLSALRIGLLVSYLSHYNYKPFGDTGAGQFFDGVEVRKHLDLRHLGNCFFIALFFQQALALGDSVMGSSVQFITGYKVLKCMRNPMLEAESPSDFWGRRWNLIVHRVMKRGVYKPVRKYASPALASLLVFIASGLFHEWLVHAVVIYGRVSSSGEVYIGSNSAFFIWNFFVIMVERSVVGLDLVKSIGKSLPRPVLTLVIIMSSLPVAHWFGNPYLLGGFFLDYERCIIMIRKA